VKNVEALEWVSLVRIDSGWIDKYLITYDDSLKEKVITRSFSIRFSGTEEHMQGLIEFMADRIKEFVLSKADVKKCESLGQDPWRRAARYFGPIDPSKEGKYGELLLFLLVEAVLKTPMIAHKIKSLSDPKDQVKGSDGVFFGPYREQNSLLLGEAKVYQNSNQAIGDALRSIDKFHNVSTADNEIKTELLIIRQTITDDLSLEQVEFLLNILDTQSVGYQKVNKVHPILIVYDEEKICEIEKNCKGKEDGEKMIHAMFDALSLEMLRKVLYKVSTKWKTLEKVYLDFFFVPVTSVEKFRNSLFKAIHNMPYR